MDSFDGRQVIRDRIVNSSGFVGVFHGDEGYLFGAEMDNFGSEFFGDDKVELRRYVD